MLVNQKHLYRTITREDYQSMSGPDWPSFDNFSIGSPIEKFVADELDMMLGNVEEKRKRLQNFCVLPFYGKDYGIGYDTPCCLLPKNHDLDKIQKSMLANIRAPECHKCWNLEDAGVLSDRQLKNYTLDHYTNIDILELYDKAMAGSNSITQYQISASNFCNSTCVTCNPGASSAWGKLLSSNQQLVNSFNLDSKKFKNLVNLKESNSTFQIDYSTAKFIAFTGGESTMIRTHWEILERLLEFDNTNCCISFTTNGSFELTQRQLSILQQFENVNFCFSIDGIGPVFEYMRYPLKWEVLVDNITKIKQYGVSVSSSYTISNLNVLYHEQTTEWLNKNQIPYLENPVYDPTYFSPRSLSYNVKQKILSTTNNNSIKSMLKEHSDQDQQNYEEFLKHIKFQDTLKNISISNYLPEFVELLDI